MAFYNRICTIYKILGHVIFHLSLNRLHNVPQIIHCLYKFLHLHSTIPSPLSSSQILCPLITNHTLLSPNSSNQMLHVSCRCFLTLHRLYLSLTVLLTTPWLTGSMVSLSPAISSQAPFPHLPPVLLFSNPAISSQDPLPHLPPVLLFSSLDSLFLHPTDEPSYADAVRSHSYHSYGQRPALLPTPVPAPPRGADRQQRHQVYGDHDRQHHYLADNDSTFHRQQYCEPYLN